MVENKRFVGSRIRRIRKHHQRTQTQMAEILGISASYLNLIEHDQRPLTSKLQQRIADYFQISINELEGSDGREILTQLAEVFADPLISDEIGEHQELVEMVQTAPNVATGVVRLYKAYQESRERLSGLTQMIASEPEQASEWARLPIDEVREKFEQTSPYYPAIERAALALRSLLDHHGNLLDDARAFLSREHQIDVQILPEEAMALWRRRYDRHSSRLFISERLSPADQIQEVLQEIALVNYRDLIEEEVALLKLTSEEAKRLARFEFARLLALACMMPYSAFLEAGWKLHFDLNILRSRFGTTFAQAAWRLPMLARNGEKAPFFFVLEVDSAGNRLRRAGQKGFPLRRFGGDCPKLVVHHAFTSPGQTFTERVITTANEEFIVVGRTIEGLRLGFPQRPHRTALLIGFEPKDATHVTYGDRGVPKNKDTVVEIGPACRLCERRGCIARAHPPITRPLGLDEKTAGISVFDFR